jgi:hypothetical protein
LIEIYSDILAAKPTDVTCAFVTHNKHDFSNMAGDERQPHPDLADLFQNSRSIYELALGELLNSYAPESMSTTYMYSPIGPACRRARQHATSRPSDRCRRLQ